LGERRSFRVESRLAEVPDIRRLRTFSGLTRLARLRGTTRAPALPVTDDTEKRRRALDEQIERWTAEAKKLVESGDEAGALELYRRAADELPGAPWLQHRTAELARKLRQPDVAINYLRRAATAFQIAEFSKRAVAPLRTAWTLAIEGLPATSKLLVELAGELIQLHRRLGFAADATVTFERTNNALRSRGFSEMGPHVLESLVRDAGVARSSVPPPAPLERISGSAPSSRASSNVGLTSTQPASEAALRGSGHSPAEATQSSSTRASARLFGQR
jgi:tetratricopeptide (TPR) repeat protein